MGKTALCSSELLRTGEEARVLGLEERERGIVNGGSWTVCESRVLKGHGQDVHRHGYVSSLRTWHVLLCWDRGTVVSRAAQISSLT